MEGREKAELKDRIKRFVVENEKRDYLIHKLYASLQEPTENVETFIAILDEMAAEKSSCFEVISLKTDKEILFKVTPLAKDIPEDKSFVAEYEREVETAKKMNEATTRSTNIQVLTEKDLKQKIRNNKIMLGIAVVSALAAIGSLAWSIYRDSNNDIKDQLNPKIDSIQIRLERLENGLKQLNRPKVIDSTQTTK